MADQAPGGGHGQAQAARRARMHLNDENNFMNIRDRLFHHMLVKVALAYSNNVPYFVRKIIEFFMLLMAISFLICLLFIHLMSTRQSASCLESYNKTWPRDGIIRLEVVENLDMLKFKEDWLAWYKSGRSQLVCTFNPAEVLRLGPAAIPAEIRHGSSYETPLYYDDDTDEDMETEVEAEEHHGYFGAKWLSKLLSNYLKRSEAYPVQPKEPLLIDPNDPYFEEAESAFTQLFRNEYNQMTMPQVVYRMEYAQFYGLLRLPYSYRIRKNISTLHIRLSSEDSCFGDSMMLFAMKNIIGYEEAVMNSLRRLAVNESLDDTGLGYLHNLNTNEHYHFITHGYSKGSYLTAAVLMVAFTFAISLLLRFSHHQIFVFIVEILHMFETAQPIQFPAAALLTVILALVGMEAIMSEIFSDTSTAFYVILVVWIADQFDAICCQSPTSRRFWLRFFYLYQFFFYAYQYRFGGQYGGIALLTSISFVLHSMIYFFHHYEMPQILYQERLQRIFSEIEAMPRMNGPPPVVIPPPEAEGNTEENRVFNYSNIPDSHRNMAARNYPAGVYVIQESINTDQVGNYNNESSARPDLPVISPGFVRGSSRQVSSAPVTPTQTPPPSEPSTPTTPSTPSTPPAERVAEEVVAEAMAEATSSAIEDLFQSN